MLSRDSMRDLEGDKMHVLVLFFLYILQVKDKAIETFSKGKTFVQLS